MLRTEIQGGASRVSPAPKRTKSLARFSPQPLNPGASAPQSSPSTRRVNIHRYPVALCPPRVSRIYAMGHSFPTFRNSGILPQRWCAEYPSDEESNWCTLWFCSHAVGRSRSIELSLAGKSNEVKSCSNDATHAREHEQVDCTRVITVRFFPLPERSKRVGGVLALAYVTAKGLFTTTQANDQLCSLAA